ncbi:citramalate synthase [Chitinivibrio alkaliphilus]|nr:citramalate synthase [Chitinivibrio alkaliphilus]
MANTQSDIIIYDTTLRDGNQAIGLGLSLQDKLEISEKLDALGLHYIEGGWPNPTNEIDTKFYREVKKLNLSAKIAAFGSTKRPHTAVDKDPFLADIIQADAPVATIYGKSWDLHVHDVIRCTEEENLTMIYESVSHLKRYKDEVIFDAEHFFDGYLNNPDYAIKSLQAAQEAGAHCLVLCDTNGGTLPGDFTRIVQAVQQEVSAPLGVHVHNDTGCAEANSIIGAELGATHIQGTINGLGERCGNANLCTIIPALQIKKGYDLISDEQMRSLRETSIYVGEIANAGYNFRAPFVGEAAFSHKAGAHVDGVRKNRKAFEHMSPELVGNKRHFVISDQAGSGTIIEKLTGIRPDIDKKDPLVKRLLNTIKEMEQQGYHFEAADGTFQLLVHKELGDFQDPFIVKGFRVIEDVRCDGHPLSEATIKIVENIKGCEKTVHTAAEGNGPVDALNHALRKAITEIYPELTHMHLEDYKVRVLAGSAGTAAKVRVLIESTDGNDRWGTIGVSGNIIEASWIALVDSIKYKLLKDRNIIRS